MLCGMVVGSLPFEAFNGRVNDVCQEWFRCTDPPSVQGKPTFSFESTIIHSLRNTELENSWSSTFLIVSVILYFVCMHVFSLQIHWLSTPFPAIWRGEVTSRLTLVGGGRVWRHGLGWEALVLSSALEEATSFILSSRKESKELSLSLFLLQLGGKCFVFVLIYLIATESRT